MIEFPVGLIAGVILSSVVVAMVAAKLVCVVSTRYRVHRALEAGDTASDTDEQRDMLSYTMDEPPRGQGDVGNDDASLTPGKLAVWVSRCLGQCHLLGGTFVLPSICPDRSSYDPFLHHHRLSFAVPTTYFLHRVSLS